MTAVCYHCGDRPAACYGAYEGSQVPATACDICCGHGNEDGWCIQIADMLEREPLVQEVIASWNEYITAYRESPNAYRANSLRVAVLRRVEALAEWRP